MQAVSNATTSVSEASDLAWPLDVRAACRALEKPAPVSEQRRRMERVQYRSEATLCLSARSSVPMSLRVYMRDATAFTASFIVREVVLPTGQRAVIELTTPDGNRRRLDCTIRRWRQFQDGWFEGVVQFDAPQAAFAPNGTIILPKPAVRQPSFMERIRSILGM